MKKRIISLALVFILAFSLLPTGALAASSKIYDVYQGDGFYITVKPFEVKSDKYTYKRPNGSYALDGKFHDGMLAVFTADVDENWVNRVFIDEYNFVDMDGNILFPEGIFHNGKYMSYALYPSNGLIPYWDGKTKDDSYYPFIGFVDYSGKVVLPCEYCIQNTTIKPVSDGLYKIGWSMIDNSGRIVFDELELMKKKNIHTVYPNDGFSDGLLKADHYSGEGSSGTITRGFIDKSGNMVLKLISYDYEEARYEYEKDYWKMYADGKMDGYLMPMDSSVYPGHTSIFSDGHTVCFDLRSGNQLDFNFAIIDTKGNVTGTFSDAVPVGDFYDGIMPVHFIDNRGNISDVGFVDTSGNVVIRYGNTWSTTPNFSCGLAYHGDYFGGLIDTKFNVVIPKEHGITYSTFIDNIALSSKGGQYYILEKHEGTYTGSGSVYNHAKGGEQPSTPTPTPTPTQQPTAVTAAPTNDSLTVNGQLQSPTVYKIDGSNYFKIRDLAAVLNGTGKQFDVGYDGALKSVTATTGKGYAKQSGDLAGAAAGGSQSAAPSNDAIYIDGTKIDATVYKINGNNYFKLRDLGQALNFYVGWTAADGVFIDTSRPYEG